MKDIIPAFTKANCIFVIANHPPSLRRLAVSAGGMQMQCSESSFPPFPSNNNILLVHSAGRKHAKHSIPFTE